MAPARPDSPPDARARRERLEAASPLYAQALQRHPEIGPWLEEPASLGPFGPASFRASWRNFAPAPEGGEDEAERFERMRQWRRRMSLRIAYRSVNGLADEPATVEELSALADFCLGECLASARRHWSERLGKPWDEDNGRPARFCVLALGKLGGRELNFSSDIDLIYCYEGEGLCRGGPGAAAVTTAEYFTKVAERVTSLLTARTGEGFLFRVDVRLRPEGAGGPLIHSLSAIENYYSTVGQTWERLALVKARPAAGELALGAELLEDLHSFRYPRRPPPSLLAEVAAMKARTEREVVGQAARERDIKRGPGGIREIEFIAQSLQLLHAGRYPFLQTGSTAAALTGLVRYELLPSGDARLLLDAYWYLRQVEHRLQMRDESQTHLLPAEGAELEAIADSLGYAGPAAFRADLDARRGRVRALYAALFSDQGLDADFELWWEFFTSPRLPPAVAERLGRWFRGAPAAAEALRLFAAGGHRPQITPDFVVTFQHLAARFDQVMPELAQPLETLARLGRCGERYGTRRRFLEICAANPQLFRALALVCDRSTYGVELLCAHPEILEEVLRPEMLRRHKDPADLRAELKAGAGADYARWLWLYVRAEQLRAIIGELLGFVDRTEVEAVLTGLADAVLRHLCPKAEFLIVALGKFGGRELTFGSDLDLLFVAREGAEAAAAAAIESLRRVLQAGNPLGPTFAVDLRLRPHGASGPLAATLPDLAVYHRPPAEAGGGPAAQTWEKQLLVRARIVAGPPDLAESFLRWRDQRLYAAPLTAGEEDEIWAMRGRIERERDAVRPPPRAFKTGSGGLVDIEFLVQTLQLRHGHAHPAVRPPGTREALHALAGNGLLAPALASRLEANLEFLKRIEFALRRDSNQATSILAESPSGREPLARWLGFPAEAEFWREHTARMAETRSLVQGLIPAASRVEGRDGSPSRP